MLARKRSAIADDEIGGLGDERSKPVDAVGRFEIEIQSDVSAAFTEVAVESTVQFVLIEKFL